MKLTDPSNSFRIFGEEASSLAAVLQPFATHLCGLFLPQRDPEKTVR